MGLKFTNEQRLMILMLCDLYKKPENREFNPVLLSSAIVGGHDWAIDWEYGAIFPEEPDNENDVSFVTDVLDMWDFIESGYSKLNTKGQDNVKAGVPYMSEAPHFNGFDGNNESKYVGIARMMVNDMGRFSRFKGRDFNSHSPKYGRYKGMLSKWEPMREQLSFRSLTPEEIIELLTI